MEMLIKSIIPKGINVTRYVTRRARRPSDAMIKFPRGCRRRIAIKRIQLCQPARRFLLTKSEEQSAKR